MFFRLASAIDSCIADTFIFPSLDEDSVYTELRSELFSTDESEVDSG